MALPTTPQGTYLVYPTIAHVLYHVLGSPQYHESTYRWASMLDLVWVSRREEDTVQLEVLWLNMSWYFGATDAEL